MLEKLQNQQVPGGTDAKKLFLFTNGPTRYKSLFLFIFVFYSKIVNFIGTRTQIVGFEGKHADHLTTTMAPCFKTVFAITVKL